jgi:hypothetical protein
MAQSISAREPIVRGPRECGTKEHSWNVRDVRGALGPWVGPGQAIIGRLRPRDIDMARRSI